MDNSSVPSARLRRRTPILICRKCMKRAPEGRDVRKELKRALKAQGRARGVKPRLIATSCFGICPKRQVVAASGATLARGEVLLVADAGAAEQAAAILLEKPTSN